jgi:hypothetical protein
MHLSKMGIEILNPIELKSTENASGGHILACRGFVSQFVPVTFVNNVTKRRTKRGISEVAEFSFRQHDWAAHCYFTGCTQSACHVD